MIYCCWTVRKSPTSILEFALLDSTLFPYSGDRTSEISSVKKENVTVSYLDPVDEHELKDLLSSDGDAEVEKLRLEIDQELYVNRFMKATDRRGEVVFAIQMPDGILVHRKDFYGNGILRLPSGGIDYGESVLDALHREVQEETSMIISSQRLLGIQDCQLTYGGEAVRFVSYIFHVYACGDVHPDPEEGIVELRAVSVPDLADIAEKLRHVPPPHEGWGRWRALAHDLVYRHLAAQA
jgi:ADP-ribose pyrophosphatase YjhB (NUDIX family)